MKWWSGSKLTISCSENNYKAFTETVGRVFIYCILLNILKPSLNCAFLLFSRLFRNEKRMEMMTGEYSLEVVVIEGLTTSLLSLCILI